MIAVDRQRQNLVERIDSLVGEADAKETAMKFFALGMSFHAAWLTGSEKRAGATHSAYEEREYGVVRSILTEYGWEDLLDYPVV